MLGTQKSNGWVPFCSWLIRGWCLAHSYLYLPNSTMALLMKIALTAALIKSALAFSPPDGPPKGYGKSPLKHKDDH